MPSMYCVVCCGHGTYSEVALSELKWVATIGIESKQKYEIKLAFALNGFENSISSLFWKIWKPITLIVIKASNCDNLEPILDYVLDKACGEARVCHLFFIVWWNWRFAWRKDFDIRIQSLQ